MPGASSEPLATANQRVDRDLGLAVRHHVSVLSPRGLNYLSQDSPDITVATMELCSAEDEEIGQIPHWNTSHSVPP